MSGTESSIARLESVFNGMLSFYRVTLRWVLNHRPVMLAMFFIVLGATGYLYVIVPKGFIPDTDNDNFNVQLEAAQGTSYYQMVKYHETVSRDRGAGSRRRDVLLQHRRRRFGGANGEQRQADGQSQAAAAARSDRDRHRQPAASASVSNIPGAARLSLGPAGHPRRRPHVEKRLRFHDVRSGHAATLRRGAEDGARHAADARPHRGLERPADQESAGEHRSWTATAPRR